MRMRLLFALAGTVCGAGALQAQTRTPDSAGSPTQDGRTRIGVGVSLAPPAILVVVSGASPTTGTQSSYLPIGLGDLFFPVLVGRKFKLEPQFGILRQTSEVSGSGSSSSTKGTSLRVGVGAFRVTPLGGSATQVYVGPRILMVKTSTSFNYSSQYSSSNQTTDETDWIIGLAVGGEHFFSRHFSIGAELQANYTSYGKPDRTPASGSQPSVNQHMIATAGLLLVRAYF